jgi:hypothetical protein
MHGDWHGRCYAKRAMSETTKQNGRGDSAAHFWDGEVLIQRDTLGNYTACRNYNPNAKTIMQMPDAADAVNLAHDYNREPLACKVQSYSDADRFARSAEVDRALENLIVESDSMLHGKSSPESLRESIQAAIIAMQTDIATHGEYDRAERGNPYADLFQRHQEHHYARASRFASLVKKLEKIDF